MCSLERILVATICKPFSSLDRGSLSCPSLPRERLGATSTVPDAFFYFLRLTRFCIPLFSIILRRISKIWRSHYTRSYIIHKLTPRVRYSKSKHSGGKKGKLRLPAGFASFLSNGVTNGERHKKRAGSIKKKTTTQQKVDVDGNTGSETDAMIFVTIGEPQNRTQHKHKATR